MADDVDLATAIAERAFDRAVAAACVAVPVGEPGDCRQCDRPSRRLVGGRCAPCRDGRPRHG